MENLIGMHIQRRYIRHLLPLVLLLLTAAGCTAIRPLADGQLRPDEPEIFSHERLERVLTKHVDAHGFVDYAGLREAPGDLEAYYRLIAAYSPDSHPRLFPDADHALAYWLNAYNGAVLKTVLTYYPIGSVLEVSTPPLLFFLSDKAGFFFLQRLTFGGRTTSLYYLENTVIRDRFADPRIHFALNCASLGCARLPRRPFTGPELDRQLEAETRRFLADPGKFAIDHDAGVIRLSSLLKWYSDDFISWYRRQHLGRPATLLNYVGLYLAPERAAELARVSGRYPVRFITYDWRLNDQHPVAD